MTLTSADLQAIAQERYCVAGKIWHVSPLGNDANDGTSFLTANAVLTPTYAAAHAAAGDLILLGGKFNLGSTGQFLPAGGVHVRGFGWSTGITGSIPAGGGSGHGSLAAIQGASIWKNFAITHTDPGGANFDTPLEVIDNGSDCQIHGLLIQGFTDGIYLAAENFVSARLRAFRCIVESQWDDLFVDLGQTLIAELYDCHLFSRGPVSAAKKTGVSFSTGLGVSATVDNTSYVRMVGGSITATGDTYNNYAAVCDDTNTLSLHGVRIITDNSPLKNDIRQLNSGKVYVTGGTSFNRAQVTGALTATAPYGLVDTYAAGQDPYSLMSAQGYTATRAAKLDNLNATVSSVAVGSIVIQDAAT